MSVTQGSGTGRGRGTAESSKPIVPPKPAPPPKPLTPLDIARNARVAEWEGKLHAVIDHHDSLARELYHLETYTTMLTYDPVKIKSDHSEKMQRVC